MTVHKGSFLFTNWAKAASYAFDAIQYGLTATMSRSSCTTGWTVKVS